MEAFKSFGVEPILLLAQIVNFLVIVFLLKKFFYGPVVKMLADRRARIEESLKNADEIEKRLEETDLKVKKAFEEARANAQAIMQDAKSEAKRIVDAATEEGHKITESALTEARSQIELERLRVQKELQAETATIAGVLLKKVLSRTMSSKEKQELTKTSVAQITKQVS